MPVLLHEDKCDACLTCVGTCPIGIISEEKGALKVTHTEDCTECGDCVISCHTTALEVEV